MPETEHDDERLMALLEGALARPAAEREGWLRGECGGDESMAAEVLDRATWEDKLGGFLREPIVPRLPGRADLLAPGAVMAGRYRVVRELGRGRATVVVQAFDNAAQQNRALRFGARDTARPPAHRGIATLYEVLSVETNEGTVSVAVMELLKGPLLAEVNGCSMAEAGMIGEVLCGALMHAARTGFMPAALTANGVIVTSRGPVLTEDWIPIGPAQAGQSEAANLTALGRIFGRLRHGDARWDGIVRKCLERRYPSMGALHRDLLPPGHLRRWLARLRRR